MQRSPSDVGKSSGDEGKKSSITRPPPTTASFGFKKIPAATELAAPKTLSAKSAGKVGGTTCVVGGARKTSLDGYRHHDDGVLLGIGGSKMPLQYRSLPRPAKSYRSIDSSTVKGGVAVAGGVTGGGAGPGPGTGAGTGTVSGVSKRKDGGKTESGRSSPVSVNQTDKEKVSVSEQEGAPPSTSPKSSPTSSQSGLRQPGSKYPDIASPTFRR